MVTVANSLLTQSEIIEEYNILTMDDQQFERWIKLLDQRIGLRASALRKTFLLNALNTRLRKIGLANHDEYYNYLHSGIKGELEWTSLIDLLTIQETWFFRHASSLALVKEYVANKSNDQKTIHTWSVGCATGEEAYTMAIILDQALTTSKSDSDNYEYGPDYYSVTASDISQSSINYARLGQYTEKQLEKIDKTLVDRYFNLSTTSKKYQISDEIKKRVCFNKVNVLEINHNSIGMMDVIYCQNLLIYFDHDKRANILDNLAQHLLPGGLLILGAGEIFQWSNPDMSQVTSNDILAYRKTGLIKPGKNQ